MLITSHLLATLLASRGLSLNNVEIYVALIAGVGIDIDHVFVNGKWVQDAKNFFLGRQIISDGNQHTWLQEFLFGSAVGIAGGLLVHSFFPTIRWWISPFFLLFHILMDSIEKYDHWPLAPFSRYKYRGFVPFGTRIELAISSIGLLVYFIFIIWL